MSTIYGIEVAENDDPYINTAEKALETYFYLIPS